MGSNGPKFLFGKTVKRVNKTFICRAPKYCSGKAINKGNSDTLQLFT